MTWNVFVYHVILRTRYFWKKIGSESTVELVDLWKVTAGERQTQTSFVPLAATNHAASCLLPFVILGGTRVFDIYHFSRSDSGCLSTPPPSFAPALIQARPNIERVYVVSN